jgi:serine/threonine protein kinase
MFRSDNSFLSRFTDVRVNKSLNRAGNSNPHNIIISETGNRYEIMGKFSDQELHEYAAQIGRMPSGKMVQFVINNLTRIRIGEGFQGKVKYIRKIHDDGSKGRFYAVKVIKKELETFSKEQAFHDFCAERNIPGMMLAVDTIYSSDGKKNPTIYQVMPVATGGDGDFLEELLNTQNQLTVQQRNLILQHLCYSLTNTLGYMHHHKIYHVDLKLANLLFNLNGEVLLSDFGSALTLDESGREVVLAVHALADTHFRPTRSICCALKKKGLGEYYERIDNWSLGLVLAQLARSTVSEYVKTNLIKLYQVQKSREPLSEQIVNLQTTLDGLRVLLMQEAVPTEMVELIMALLDVNPAVNQYIHARDALIKFGIKALAVEERNVVSQLIEQLVMQYRPVVYTEKTVLVASIFKANFASVSRYIAVPLIESDEEFLENYFSKSDQKSDAEQHDSATEEELEPTPLTPGQQRCVKF